MKLKTLKILQKKGVFTRYDPKHTETCPSFSSLAEEGLLSFLKGEEEETMFLYLTPSGTEALKVALKTIGVRAKSFVLLPRHTYKATELAIRSVGAWPFFISVSDDLNMEPYDLCLSIAYLKERGQPVSAVVPVHMYGNPCNIHLIKKMAEEENIPVVEDACQAFGTRTKEGKPVGAVGDIGCFSFNHHKLITSGGEGGAIITRSPVWFQKAKFLLDPMHEPVEGYKPQDAGSVISELSSAYLCDELKTLREKLASLKELFSYLLTSEEIKKRAYVPEQSSYTHLLLRYRGPGTYPLRKASTIPHYNLLPLGKEKDLPEKRTAVVKLPPFLKRGERRAFKESILKALPDADL